MPHIETMVDDKERLVFKVRPQPPREEWKPTKMTLKILDREDVSAPWGEGVSEPSQQGGAGAAQGGAGPGGFIVREHRDM